MKTAIRARHSLAQVFGASKVDKPVDDFYSSGQAQLCPPDRSAHISNHDAVHIDVCTIFPFYIPKMRSRSLTTLEPQSTGIRAKVFERAQNSQRRSLETGFEAACRKAQKKGRKPPTKREYYHDHWGTPYAIGFPFLAVPVLVAAGAGYYFASNPSSMPEGTGMHGGRFIFLQSQLTSTF
jgi:hypothetical protein